VSGRGKNVDPVNASSGCRDKKRHRWKPEHTRQQGLIDAHGRNELPDECDNDGPPLVGICQPLIEMGR
jgi:hypothetical protein